MSKHRSNKLNRELLEVNDLRNHIHDRMDEHIVGKHIEIGTGEACDQLRGATLEDCEVRLRCPGRFTQVATAKCTFVRCVVWAHQIQKVPSWNAEFYGCVFKGRYDARFSGIVEDCDFSQSNLDSALFLQDTGLGNTCWPAWPHIIIDDPKNNYEEWKRIRKPKKLSRYVWKLRGIATVVNLKTTVNDPDEVWETLKDHSFIRSNRPN